ncbi:hypothetical protein, variant 1 [Saprolegnia diclina VS20]|uniref:t-SNARE coiled-coil homology domain-containing protein n=2 Tax=Saprolegnia TaxID=4769 RepID=A0A067CY58_SAPPC|nr:hypothetical protein, variant 1 [Saprolegnia diclina VS20]XP_012197590.1 hypothetical protein SPRG_03625 [Saprolegnia parasitica CBS 223.65]EQC32421.1 hypothetical protein, variant 1 [Saprolegnia diclina VS20]KDO31707.1 hypothetical protein SPRG_03625 [Saprolegnia parasitica CBS 223.65]|eukprot:XP_008614362.1 hypothetical protein, variant 1 [Saprolegnia diclina VS20]
MRGRSEYTKPDDEEASFLNEGQTQQMEMHKQDEELGQLHDAVKRLGDMSKNISAELDTQNHMLDEVNADTDRAQDNLDVITQKTRELVKQAGGMQNFCIIIALSLVLIILTYLVIMT